ncbi:stage III sporulation protein SpoIIIAB [Brevibacillus laterosporus]|uniref:stage III sporulation protein SpoIIIAB n=1 Tax=Brevibacillus TaxID=55080 RepID=UPI001B2DA551|nr:stage III sporulation protein SpoIIIAB [Brevibacillus halotolerans]GIO00127.1 hypothetical protein J5TS2_07950 [Brevibacillus halotolerans]
MLKIGAAIVVLVSASLIGIQLGKRYSDRVKELRALLHSLQMLETEIVYGATPLSLAFEKISVRVTRSIGNLYKRASELLQTKAGESTQIVWQTALEQTWSLTALRKEEKEILKNLGYVMGNSDREDQKKHLQLTVFHLRGLEEEAKEEQLKYEKMYKNLGFLGGLLIVILMM